MECHPDRGGSHQAMLDVIEAFKILANPETRRHYEDARNESFDQNAKVVIQADIFRARQTAEEYPRSWSAFDAWMYEDFTNAEYGESWSYFQTVKNSTSGVLFWIVGAIIGGFIAFIVMAESGMNPGWGVKIILLGASLGVGAALCIHQKIADSMRKPATPNSPRPASSMEQITVTQCRMCKQQMRIKSFGETLRIRCPNSKCRFEFYFDPKHP